MVDQHCNTFLNILPRFLYFFSFFKWHIFPTGEKKLYIFIFISSNDSCNKKREKNKSTQWHVVLETWYHSNWLLKILQSFKWSKLVKSKWKLPIEETKVAELSAYEWINAWACPMWWEVLRTCLHFLYVIIIDQEEMKLQLMAICLAK